MTTKDIFREKRSDLDSFLLCGRRPHSYEE